MLCPWVHLPMGPPDYRPWLHPSLCVQLEVEGGTLTISPVKPEWVTKTADLLTATFVDSGAAKLAVYK